MKIIMDSLVPNHRKKQLMPDRIMEPPEDIHIFKRRVKVDTPIVLPKSQVLLSYLT